MQKIIASSVALMLCMNLTACGTIMHPERKGQVDGRIDVGIAALDAIGLLFFFIPGVVAFAVDFSNGTIYLPGGHSAQLSSDQMKTIAANGQVDLSELSHVASAYVPQAKNVQDYQVEPVANSQQLAMLFEQQNSLFAAR